MTDVLVSFLRFNWNNFTTFLLRTMIIFGYWFKTIQNCSKVCFDDSDQLFTNNRTAVVDYCKYLNYSCLRSQSYNLRFSFCVSNSLHHKNKNSIIFVRKLLQNTEPTWLLGNHFSCRLLFLEVRTIGRNWAVSCSLPKDGLQLLLLEIKVPR